MSEQKLLLVFFSSPHNNGHTAKLLNLFLENVDRNKFHVEIINAYHENISPCLGCRYCATQESCAAKDFDKIDGLLRQADGIVVASPVYNLSFPAPFKAILDRTQRYFEARFSLGKKPPIQRPKAAVFLVVQGSSDLEGVSIMEKQLSMAFSVMNTKLIDTVLWKHTDSANHEMPRQVRERAAQVSLAIQQKIC